MACLYKKKALFLTLYRIMFFIGFFGVLYFGGNAIFHDEAMLPETILPGLLFLAVLIISFNLCTASYGGIIAPNPYAGVTEEKIHTHAVSRDEGFLLQNSYNFIECIPLEQIPEGKVAVRLGAFDLDHL